MGRFMYIFVFLFFASVFASGDTTAAATASTTTTESVSGQDYEFNVLIKTDWKGNLKSVEPAGFDWNLETEDLDLIKNRQIPNVRQIEYSHGHALEIMNNDHAYCGSWINSPTVNLWATGTKGVLYLLALIYFFLGVSIVADVFMTAIEVITSQTASIPRILTDENGVEYTVTIEVRLWNETVANLTLLALGSSAPEILLAVLEALFSLGEEAGELGPATIVGSAAFNLFVISAICAISVPDGEERALSQIGVFYITAASSVWAYVWLLLCIVVISAERVDLWEAWLTFLMFPLLVGVAYAQDVDLFCTSEDGGKTPVDKLKLGDMVQERIRSATIAGKTHEQAAKDVQLQLQKEALSNKSRLWWRINGARVMAGKKPLVSADDKQLLAQFDATDNDKEMENLGVRPVRSFSTIIKDENFNTVIGFRTAEYSVREDEGIVTVLVYRDGDKSKEHLVTYETADGTAKAGSDYIAKNGVIRFDPGEEVQKIDITVLADDEVETDEYFRVVLTSLEGTDDVCYASLKMCNIRIIDVSQPGEVGFATRSNVASESQDTIQIQINREKGSTDRIECRWETKPHSALPGVHYGESGVQQELTGTLVFQNNESSGVIEIPLLNTKRRIKLDDEEDEEVENDPTFTLTITEATNGATVAVGKASTLVTITDDAHYSELVKKVYAALDAGQKIETSTWKEQFLEAIDYDETADMSGTTMFLHCLSFPWKVMFAFIPPTSYYGGWLTFGCSLSVIGLVTMVIGELASTWGCMLGIPEAVVAITVVALGTSMPDTFASITATQMSSDADAAIGNITGSNSVNVFLGLGLPWMISSVYAEATNSVYVTPKGTLATSVMVFCPCAAACLGTFIIREWMGIGALGGSKEGRWAMAAFFVSLWLIFLTCAILASLDKI